MNIQKTHLSLQLLLVVAMLSFSFISHAQETATGNIKSSQSLPEDEVLTVVEQMPVYPGGEKALLAFIGANLHYPVIAQENGIQGTIIVRFVVTKTGSVDKVEVLRSLDPACDKEAVRVINLLPQWVPGKQKGENVSVYYALPIKYKLTGEDKGTKKDRNRVQPLYIIDGRVVSIEELNSIKPVMIKEVSVLKDASALAAYGDKGKNGVVLITLKKDAANQIVDSVKNKVGEDNATFEVVEQMPEYPGGERSLMNFIGSNLRYPVEAQKARIQGTVILRFVVNKEGNVERTEVIRSLNPDCDRESIRVINLLSAWKPGMQKGKAVSVWYTLPIKFKLE